MRALIYGAGVAGLALAARLARARWEVVVAEEAPAPRDEGYVIDLFGSGYDAADRMGLLPRLEELSQRFSAVRWVNGSGRTMARLSYKRLEQLFEGRLLSLVRGDLERAVLEHVPTDVELRYGARIDQVRTPLGAVEARLATGQTIRGDVLIGADGIHSRVRDLVFGEGSSWIRLLGFETASFVAEAADLDAELGDELHVVSAPGRQLMLYPLREGRVAASFVHRTKATLPPRSPFEALQAVYGDLDWCVPAVLELARELPDLLYTQVGQVVMAHWSRGRIALLGDACQAVSLLPGQGASLSLAAAYVLAEELNSGLPVKEALARYERRVRPPLIRMRRSGRRAADWFVPATAIGLILRNGIVRLANRKSLARLLQPVVEIAREDLLSAPADTGAYMASVRRRANSALQ